MKVFKVIYVGLSYIIMMPWAVVKTIAFIVFVTSLSILAVLYVLLTGDLKDVLTLFKTHLNKELKLLWNEK